MVCCEMIPFNLQPVLPLFHAVYFEQDFVRANLKIPANIFNILKNLRPKPSKQSILSPR